LYPHKFSDWVRGEPWYFYLMLLGTKLPLLSLAGLIGGFVVLFRKKMGDGRYFLLLWMAIWGLAFMFVGGKFARYVITILPAVIITAAIGIQFAARKFGRLCARWAGNESVKVYARAALPSVVILFTFWSAVTAAPHYRLYVNRLGGGASNAGAFFPQDEFYDAYMQQVMIEIAKRATPNARVASEIQTVGSYYGTRAGRGDLVCVELSDPAELEKLRPGDFVVDARGRMYFSNQAILSRLRLAARPAFTVSVGTTPAADVYVLDQTSLDVLRGK
jgi:hypothetical protein